MYLIIWSKQLYFYNPTFLQPIETTFFHSSLSWSLSALFLSFQRQPEARGCLLNSPCTRQSTACAFRGQPHHSRREGGEAWAEIRQG